MSMWTNEQVEQWRLLYRAYTKDAESVKRHKDIDQRRQEVQQELLRLLRSFLDSTVTLAAFNTRFQQKTRNEWNVFHLRGMSGGLFLNKLVRYVPSEDTFGHLLRLMIRAPEGMQDGRRQMQAFVRFLEGLVTSHQVTRAQLQSARVPFFLSAWWHLQNPEHWPISYLNLRQTLLKGETRPLKAQDPVEVYFAFRTRFLALTQALGISTWELEHLTSWGAQRDAEASGDEKGRTSSGVNNDTLRVSRQKQTCVLTSRAEAKNLNGTVAGEKESSAYITGQPVSCRTHLQWLLAKLGQKVGCRVWIAASDHSKICQHERLGNLSLPSLPLVAEGAFQQIIRQIDVIWLLDNAIVAAYEIEQAHTDVSSSLLRLYDLGALFPTPQVHLCVVAPRERFEKVRFELSRPTFRGRDLRKQCSLISEELLLQQEAHILRWASSPAVIEELIGRADDGAQH